VREIAVINQLIGSPQAGSLRVLFAQASWQWKLASEASWQEEWGEEK